MKGAPGPLLALILGALLAACGNAGRGAGDSPEAPPPELTVTFEQDGSPDVRRDQPLVLRFSDALDEDSVRTASIRVFARANGLEQPVRVEVRERTILLHPPAPFGFEGDGRFRLEVAGFPSPLAPRTPDGRPLSETFAGAFTTSPYYRPDMTPPVVESIELKEEEAGFWSVVIRFSETVDPASVVYGTAIRVTSGEDDTAIPGRLMHDRHAAWFHFLPEVERPPGAVRVLVTSGIADLAGNPLQQIGREDVLLELDAAFARIAFGEIVEDFTSTAMMDPAGTTALWNDRRGPGALLGEPARTTLILGGERPDVPDRPEAHLAIGGEATTLRVLLRQEDLGPARPFTGLLWAPWNADTVQAEYEGISVTITPTLRESLEEPGFDLEPQVVLDQERYRVESGVLELVPIAFAKTFSYDGVLNVILEVRIGAGTHTNTMRARESFYGEAWAEQGGVVRSLIPVLALRSFAMEPTATSRFYDTGSPSPEYFDPVLHPAEMPRGARIEMEFQGAHALSADGRSPAAGTATGWVENVRLISGSRYVRFRATFRGMSVTGDEILLDDLRIPFRR